MSGQDRANDPKRVIFDAYGSRGGYRGSMIHTAPDTNEAMENFVKDPKNRRVVASDSNMQNPNPPKNRRYK
jgi:hypothetical protein